MFKNLQKDNRGFTIIEVLIVLAIAGLIMLIVFLAIPALQRNQRNNARNSDASRIASAISECLANRNGNDSLCDEDSEIEQGNTSQLTTITEVTTDTFSTTGVSIRFNRECTDAGDSAASTTGPRTFAVMYYLEPTVKRCISS